MKKKKTVNLPFVQKDEKTVYRDGVEVAIPIALPLIDRIRILFGSPFQVQVRIATQWRIGQFETNTYSVVEKVFSRFFPSNKK